MLMTQESKLRRKRLLVRVVALCAACILMAGCAGLYLLNRALGLTPFDILRQELPENDRLATDYPDRYMTDFTDSMPRQGLNQCAAYATAYLLRYNGEEAEGGAVYEALDHKLSGGYVMPQGILDYARDKGYTVHFYRGDVAQLKAHVASGTPVIVLIGRRSYQHYVTLVGYEGDTLYFYDSLEHPPEGAAHYNNTMGTEDFLQLWNNGIPFFQRVYCIIEPAR